MVVSQGTGRGVERGPEYSREWRHLILIDGWRDEMVSGFGEMGRLGFSVFGEIVKFLVGMLRMTKT